ncbi:hypothetical protein HID58_059041 [Brassica napus]|uniref:Uncharacterized protein n=1 Tax=Brassica napus TaxID=3708 RepID=A0ABQ7ZRS5_BRANA|nr:hypothetical protein HID58_059041 [Brassica napus]
MTTLLSSRSLISSHLPGLLHQIKDRNRRSKPRALLSSQSLVPLVGSSSSDQGSKLVTDNVSGFSRGFLRHLRRYRGRLSSPHGVSSFHLCRLLRQINNRYRGRTLSGSSWRFLLLHVRVEDSVRVDGVSSVGDKFTTINIFLLSIHECM